MTKARLNRVTGVAAILMERATPDTYHTNPFRVLELPVDCGELELNKRIKLIEIATKTDQPIPPGDGRALTKLAISAGPGYAVRNEALLLTVVPTEESPTPSFEEASRRLLNPEERLVDEFFWFWPHRLGESAEDEALVALRNDDLERAVDLWAGQANALSEDNASLHNLAVLSHASALDLELRARERPLSALETKEAAIYWRQTFSRWKQLLSQEAFWGRLRRRVGDFGDPRISDATVDEIGSSLPKTLLLINARLALEASQRGDAEGVRRQLAFMDGSEFAAECKADALVTSVGPLRQQISALCNAAKLNAENDPVHADQTTKDMLANCRAPLGVIDSLLDPNTPARVAAHDEVAAQGLANIQGYARKTDGWKQAADIAGQLVGIAASPSIKGRVGEAASKLREAAASGDDWCGEGYFELPASLVSGLERAREKLRAGDCITAITMLEELYVSSPDIVGPREESLVLKPLATSLDVRAWQKFRAGADVMEAPTTLILNIQSQALKNSQYFQYTRQLVSSPGGMSRANTLWYGIACMACGRSWSVGNNDWVVLTYGNEKSLICPACKQQDAKEVRERNAQFDAAIKAAAKDFLRANKLDPTNPAVVKSLSTLRDIARSRNIRLPDRPDSPVLPERGAKPHRRASEPTVTPVAAQPTPVPQSPSPSGSSAPLAARAARDTRPSGQVSRNLAAGATRPASDWPEHLVAWFVDWLLLLLTFAWIYFTTLIGRSGLTVLLLPMVYFAGSHLLFGRTLGERVAGVRVFNMDGSALGFGQMLIRAIALALHFTLISYALPALILLMIPLTNRNRRGLHDLLSGSQMMKVRS